MSNLELFNRYTKRLFDALSENFPLEMEITLAGLTKPDDIFEAASDGEWNNKLTKEAAIAMDKMMWLKNSGYIYFKSFEDTSFFSTYLTEKGLAAAGLKLPILNQPE